MTKNIKRALSLFLAFCLLFPCLSLFAFATPLDSDEPVNPDFSHDHAEAIEPRVLVGSCITPDCWGYVVTACMDESILYGEATHKPLFGEECQVYYYASREYEYCPACDTFYDELPLKMCWQMHLSCSLSPIYDVCTAEFGPEVFDN